uniref:hypothetical protein n=1 Tax=Riemerella anatipestifer TaxID=34085 RepID=UPI0030EF4189
MRLAYAKFCFHKYLLEASLVHKFNLLFWLGVSSVQKEYFALSVLAFLLVLCVLRGGRCFLRLEARYKSLELSIASPILKPNLQPLIPNI